MSFLRWWTKADPTTPPETQKRNFLYVEIDAVGIGLANAASPYLPVFLTRLGATNVQVGLLTSMPALTGLFLSIFIGNFLQGRRKIVPWFSRARLLVISSYTLTGLLPFFVPEEYLVQAILLVWAIATIPQIMLNVAFSVVMNAVAGPEKRYDLMSRRWSILGLTSAITVLVAGQVLDAIGFPLNYQVVFIGLSLGGLISYYFSSRIDLPDILPPAQKDGLTRRQRITNYVDLIRGEREFVSFTAKRLVYLTGVVLAAPLFPLYYVRVVHASNAWIGIIATAQTAVMLVGYYLWTRQSKKRGSRFVLLWTTFGLSLYPALVSQTQQVQLIALLAGIAGVFQAGLDLVFFDELMKTIPVQYSATFVSFAQSVQYVSMAVAPLVGTYLADQIGIPGALMVSAAIRFVGFLLFAGGNPFVKKTASPSLDSQIPGDHSEGDPSPSPK